MVDSADRSPPQAVGTLVRAGDTASDRMSAGEASDSAPPDPIEPMTLYVCVTCRDANHVVGQGAPCAGARLHAAIVAAPGDASVQVVAVECLSACKRSCSVSYAAPGKWSYVFGDLDESLAETILLGARLYARAEHGLIEWKQRPDILKKGVVARVPAPDRST